MSLVNVVSLRRVSSFEERIPRSETQLGDLLQDASAPTAYDRILESQTRDLVHQLLRRLHPRERLILIRRFDLDGRGHRTLKQIAKRLRLSRERIRQLERDVLIALRIMCSSEPAFQEIMGAPPREQKIAMRASSSSYHWNGRSPQMHRGRRGPYALKLVPKK